MCKVLSVMRESLISWKEFDGSVSPTNGIFKEKTWAWFTMGIFPLSLAQFFWIQPIRIKRN